LDDPEAIVYRHSDGYPSAAGADILRFFNEVRAQTDDTRFYDSSYLAAKYVVFLAGMFARKFIDGKWEPSAPLDFLNVGIVHDDPGDIEYRYVVTQQLTDGGRPTVFVYEMPGLFLGEIATVLAAIR